MAYSSKYSRNNGKSESIAESYNKIGVLGDYTAWLSANEIDDAWDSFLESKRDGQHEQTSRWALIKRRDGWKCLRIIFTLKNQIWGGYQILYKRKGILGNIGYISKGPIVPVQDNEFIDFVVKTIRQSAKKNKIRLLLVQPADCSSEMSSLLKEKGFCVNYIDGIYMDATLSLELEKREDELLGDMKRQKRQNIKKGIKKGVSVREGSKEDLHDFFCCMTKTCERQGFKPNPSSCEFFHEMWDLFSPGGNFKLFIAEYKNEMVSAIVAIPFGDTVYFYKFGWSGKYGKCRPNDLLYWEIIKWSKKQGYKSVDLVSVDRGTAEKKLNGQAERDNRVKGTSLFKLGFGGEILYLPETTVYIYNTILALFYRISFRLLNSRPAFKAYLLNKVK